MNLRQLAVPSFLTVTIVCAVGVMVMAIGPIATDQDIAAFAAMNTQKIEVREGTIVGISDIKEIKKQGLIIRQNKYPKDGLRFAVNMSSRVYTAGETVQFTVIKFPQKGIRGKMSVIYPEHDQYIVN